MPWKHLADAPGGPATGNPYPTLREHNGARHVLGIGPVLGAAADEEADGQPDASANGDDTAGATPDDEDGVVFDNPPLNPGTDESVTVTASGARYC